MTTLLAHHPMVSIRALVFQDALPVRMPPSVDLAAAGDSGVVHDANACWRQPKWWDHGQGGKPLLTNLRLLIQP